MNNCSHQSNFTWEVIFPRPADKLFVSEFYTFLYTIPCRYNMQYATFKRNSTWLKINLFTIVHAKFMLRLINAVLQ